MRGLQMKLEKLKGVTQFYIPESLIRKFLAMRTKYMIDDLDLNIVIDLDGKKTSPSIRILNGDVKEGKFVEIKREAE